MPRYAALVALATLVCFGGCAPAATPAAHDPVTAPVAEPVAEVGEGEAPPAAAGCDADDDCPADHVCEGEGCGPGLGTCAPAGRMCTRDLQPYCGCDGVTFRSSGSCPGARFEHRGTCDDAEPGPI